jgi:hypothetical protein
MQQRRLFRKDLGSINLDEALRVFIRINSGGRPVQEEDASWLRSAARSRRPLLRGQAKGGIGFENLAPEGGKALKNLTPEGGKVLKESSGKGP